MEGMFAPQRDDTAEFSPHHSSTIIGHQQQQQQDHSHHHLGVPQQHQSSNNNNQNQNNHNQSVTSVENDLFGLSSTDSDFHGMSDESSTPHGKKGRGLSIISHLQKNSASSPSSNSSPQSNQDTSNNNTNNNVTPNSKNNAIDDDDEEPLATRQKKFLTDYDKQRVRLSKVIEMLTIDCDKMRHFAFLPFYFLMLISIFILLLLHRADTQRAKSTIRFPNVVAQVTNETSITKLETSNDARNPMIFFNATNTMLRNLKQNYIDTTDGALWILPMAIVRQVRVPGTECWTGSAFFTPPSDNDPTTNDCPGAWADAADAPDYSIYKKNADKQITVNSVSTPVSDFGSPEAEFITTIRLWNSTMFNEDVNSSLTNQYIDDNTRGLVYNLVFSFPDSGTVLLYSIYWITTDGGLVMIRSHKETLNLFSVQRGFISMDSVVLLLSLFLLTITLLEVYDNWGRIDKEALKGMSVTGFPRLFFTLFSPWQIITFMTLLMIFIVSILRLQMWRAASKWINGVPQDPEPSVASLLESYQDAVSASENYLKTYELYGYAFMLTTYRFGYAAQHLSKLSLIARTFRNAIGDLMRVLNVFAISMLVYSMIFHAVFGQMLSSMRTLPRTAIVLVRMIISGDADPPDYAAMRQSSFALEADLFLIAFFVLFWLLLLNFVLAIISSAFMNSYMEVRNADTIVNVIQTYVLFNAPMYYVDRFHRPDDLQNMGAGRRAAAAALSVPPSYYTRLRLLLMIWRWRVSALNHLNQLQKTIERDLLDPTVARHELPTLMPPPDLRSSLTLFKSIGKIFRLRGADDNPDPASAASPTVVKPQQQEHFIPNVPSIPNAADTSLGLDSWDSNNNLTSTPSGAVTSSTSTGGIEMNSFASPSSPTNANTTTNNNKVQGRDEKKILRSRASEAGLRAVAFLVNELFDAVHQKELAEAQVALDTHTRTMKKLNRATNRIKYITSAVGALEASLKRSGTNLFASINPATGGGGDGADPGNASGLFRRRSSLTQLVNSMRNITVTPPGSTGSLRSGGNQGSGSSLMKNNSSSSGDNNNTSTSGGGGSSSQGRNNSHDFLGTDDGHNNNNNNNSYHSNNSSSNRKVSFKSDLEDHQDGSNFHPHINNFNNNHFRMSASGSQDPLSFASLPSGTFQSANFQSANFPPPMMPSTRAGTQEYNDNNNNNNASQSNFLTSPQQQQGRNEGRAPPPPHHGRSSAASLFGGTGLIYNSASATDFGVSNGVDGNFHHDDEHDQLLFSQQQRQQIDVDDDVERLMLRANDSEMRLRQQQRMDEAMGML